MSKSLSGLTADSNAVLFANAGFWVGSKSLSGLTADSNLFGTARPGPVQRLNPSQG